MKSLAERWGGTDGRTNTEQLTLDCAKTTGRGGRPANAGRPTKDRRGEVAHEARAEHKAYLPTHITLRCVAGLPNLRLVLLHDVIVNCIREAQSDSFRIVHYSIQTNHIHSIIEANEGCLVNGVRGFRVRVSRRLNTTLHRRGPLWHGRYHRHDLRTPREVRHAIVYVLANGVKHGDVARGELDPCSSAAWFDGWATRVTQPAGTSPVAPPQTWLLREGWTKVFPGYLLFSEAPQAPRPSLARAATTHTRHETVARSLP